MPRPDIYSPSDTIITITRALGDWHAAHAAVIEVELGELDGVAQARALADDLDARQKAFDREQVEDKALTTERDGLLEDIRNFDRDVRASIERRLKNAVRNQGKEDKVKGARALSDFIGAPPSDTRSAKAAKSRLDDIDTALAVHAAKIDAKGPARVQGWRADIAAFQASLVDITLRLGKESKETSDARDARDKVVADAIEFITDMDLGAQAVRSVSLAPLTAIQLIFETHNPATF